MDENEEGSPIDRFVDGLIAGREDSAWGLLAGSAELTALAWLARRLQRALRPVEPTPAFRAALHASLVASARRQEVEYAPSWAVLHKRHLLIGAAVGSTLSLAGVLAYVLHRREAGRRAA